MNDFVSFTIFAEQEIPLPIASFLPKRREDVHNYALRHVIHAARALGHRVEIAAVKETWQGGSVIRELLIVNGHPCTFQCSSNRFTNRRAKRSYTKTMVSYSTLRLGSAAIICTLVSDTLPHVFVIPSSVLLATYFAVPKRTAMLWLPVERLPPYKNMHPKIDYWQYENAWPIYPASENITS